MDADMAARLAASIDPKALSALQNRNGDPAVARAAAAQFGAFLMQGMMQNADGSAISMADGTGGPAVSSMFASAMGRYAMSGDKLGLADTIYRSMMAKETPNGHDSVGGGNAAPDQVPAGAANRTASSESSGISLAPYWQDGGRRPLGPGTGRLSQPAGLHAPAKKAADGGTGRDTAGSTPRPRTSSGNEPSATQAVESQGAQPPQYGLRAHWEGLSLPMQAHVLLPPPESDPAAQTVAATTPVSGQGPTTTAPMSVGDAASGPLPHGLPWTHSQRLETGASNQHEASASPRRHGSFEEAENFVEEVAPAINEAATRLGVSPRALLAQAALETGWGHSIVGNNIFGIKAGASWSGSTVTAETHEMKGGHLVAHEGTFRSYANIGQAVSDYVGLVSASKRYRAALGVGDNVAAYAEALAAGDYASDRDYAAKLIAVANSSKMSYAVASLDDESPGQLVAAHG